MTHQISDARLGIDLGGTKIEAVLLSHEGDIIAKQRVATPTNDYQASLQAINHVIELVSAQQPISPNLPIGIGTPGAYSQKTGLMVNCNNNCLNHQPLPSDLARVTGRQVRIANDADCFVLSEASDGAASTSSNVFGVILGTGVGGGIVINQHIVEGANSIAGEWGHNSLALAAFQPSGISPEFAPRDCYCGRKDCVEKWLAGPSFERSYLEMTGQALTAQEIVASAIDSPANNPASILLENYTNLLALALSNVINVLDPEVIVLGGGMSNINSLYDRLPAFLPRYVFGGQVNTRILPAQFGDASGVRGAAWLWSCEEVNHP